MRAGVFIMVAILLFASCNKKKTNDYKPYGLEYLGRNNIHGLGTNFIHQRKSSAHKIKHPNKDTITKALVFSESERWNVTIMDVVPCGEHDVHYFSFISRDTGTFKSNTCNLKVAYMDYCDTTFVVLDSDRTIKVLFQIVQRDMEERNNLYKRTP